MNKQTSPILPSSLRSMLLASVAFISLGMTYNSLSAATIEETQEYNFPMAAQEELIVQVSDADVKIVGSSDTTEAFISIYKKAKSSSQEKAQQLFDSVIFHCSKEGNQVLVESEQKRYQQKGVFFGNVHFSAEVDIIVPTNISVKVRTSDGNLELSNIQGTVNLTTSDGNIDVRDIVGNISLRTSDGDVETSNIRGNMTLKTSDGNITLGDCIGDVSARTSDGDLILEGIEGDLNASTSDGDIEATLLTSPSSDCSLTTSDGSIELLIAPDVAADLEIRVSDGGYQLNELEVRADSISKRNFKGAINGGGSRLYLKTSDGDIDVSLIK